jgi:hypothetical protein
MIFFRLIFFISVYITFGYRYRLWKRFFLSFNKVINHYRRSVFINFLRLILVLFSIRFLWWLNINIINIPSLFLYVDFFVPLFYTVFVFFLFFLSLKVLFKELTYKFLVDYLAKNRIYKIKNIKFVDFLLNNIVIKIFRFNQIRSIYSGFYLKRKNFNRILILALILFFII